LPSLPFKANTTTLHFDGIAFLLNFNLTPAAWANALRSRLPVTPFPGPGYHGDLLHSKRSKRSVQLVRTNSVPLRCNVVPSLLM
jgi:hypothetical protein